ncbi:hypothetical protein KXD93_25380 [Mucilaginibacter sp. BJC16-A38]|uniref:hypothetical protein n=1 Tax=Mucilaginibacter phenanthrenivorans TaxID=1234842 RepID=UPI002157969C|nr:hypothetical protein [Mucilaginibacter phenanthrenivorans]MCR8561014.1 hypothetical protein [Mucilaginibacter phenanthrenivorans]
MRTLKLITRFYSGIFLANFLVTLSCIGLLIFYGAHAMELIGVLFWYKIITIGMIFSTWIYYKKKELYYYQNLGISKIKLAVATSTFDFLLWLIAIIITTKR